MPYGFNEDKSKYDLGDIRTEIENINVGTLNKKRSLIFIGDSYQKGTNANTNFLTEFKNKYGNQYKAIYNAQEGGYGFAKANSQFITLLRNLEGKVGDPNKITDIIVTGGYNDYNNVNGVDGAIKTFMTYATSTYPNACVWLAPVGWTKNYSATNRNTVMDAIRAWHTSGATYGARVILNIACLFRDPTLLLDSDKMHPTDEGHRQLAKYINQGINAGGCEIVQGSGNVGYTKASGISTDGMTSLYSYARNGQCVVYHSARSTIKFSNPKTIKCTGTNADLVDLGTVPKCKTLGYTWASDTTVITSGTTINVIMQLNGTTNFVNVSCFVFIRHGHLYLSAYHVPATGGFQTITTPTIYVPPFEFTVNNLFG